MIPLAVHSGGTLSGHVRAFPICTSALVSFSFNPSSLIHVIFSEQCLHGIHLANSLLMYRLAKYISLPANNSHISTVNI